MNKSTQKSSIEINDKMTNDTIILEETAKKLSVKTVFMSFVGVVVLLAFLIFSMQLLRETELQTNKVVVDKTVQLRISGRLLNIDATKVKTVVEPLLGGDFLDLDLAKIREKILNLPWALQVSVQKIYPNTLVIKVTEQQAVAVWNEKSYLNPWGDVFSPKEINTEGLIKIKGSQDKAKIILRLYALLKDSIGKPQLQSLLQSDKGIYRLNLTNGIEVVLGRKHLGKRIGRLKEILAILDKRLINVRKIDLRYRRGVALQLKGNINV